MVMQGLTEEQERTGRVYVRLPEASVAELGRYIERSGVTRSQFLAMALMLGARALDRSLNPEQMMTPTMLQQMSEQMAAVLMKPEAMQKMIEMVSQLPDIELPQGQPVPEPGPPTHIGLRLEPK